MKKKKIHLQSRNSWDVRRKPTSRTKVGAQRSMQEDACIQSDSGLNLKEIIIQGLKFQTDNDNIDIRRVGLSGSSKKIFLMHSSNDAGVDLLIIYHDWINNLLDVL